MVAANGRLIAAPTRDDALDNAVDAWCADVRAGRGRAHGLATLRFAALNDRARQCCIEAGLVAGAELEASGGRRYAAGDPVMTLAQGDRGRFVTNESGTVTSVGADQLTVRFDDGRSQRLAGEEIGADRLGLPYAVTVHRMQGATVGRELAYVT